MDCRVTFSELQATAVFHEFGMYCVGVVVICNHDLFETTAGCDRESAGLIPVIFPDKSVACKKTLCMRVGFLLGVSLGSLGCVGCFPL